MSNSEGVSQLFGYWLDGEYCGHEKPEALSALENADKNPNP